MTKIYRISDKIPFKIANLTFWVSPLTYLEKSAIQDQMFQFHKTQDVSHAMQGSRLCIKYGVKDVEGLSLFDGSPYELEFEDNGRWLTDGCVDDLLNLSCHGKIVEVCTHLLNGVPDDLQIEGVSFAPLSKPKSRRAK